jgi:hypothetical protein
MQQAGRVVGPKGATIQQLKVKSGATQVRMQKDPRDFSGVLLRVLSIEGTLVAIRRLVNHIFEAVASHDSISHLCLCLQSSLLLARVVCGPCAADELGATWRRWGQHVWRCWWGSQR